MHVTRGSTQAVTKSPRPVPLRKPKHWTCSVACRIHSMRTRGGALKRALDSRVQADLAQAAEPAVHAQVEVLGDDEHSLDAQPQGAEAWMGQAIASSEACVDAESSEPARLAGHSGPRDAQDREDPIARAPSRQRTTPVGRMCTMWRPYGDLDGTIDPSGAGELITFWDDTPQPGQLSGSSASSSLPSSVLRRGMFPKPPSPVAQAVATPVEPMPAPSGQMVLYTGQPGSHLPTTGSRSSPSMPGSRIQGIMEALRECTRADETAARAVQVARAIEAEESLARYELLQYQRRHPAVGASGRMRPRPRKPARPSQHSYYLTTNARPDAALPAMPRLLHKRQSAVQLPSSHSAQPSAMVVFAGQPGATEQALPAANAAPRMALALQGDEASRQAAWARASSAISEAVQRLVPPALGRNKRGGPLVTSKMRDHANKVRAACQLVGTLALQTCVAVLGRDSAQMAEKLHDEDDYAVECADALVKYFARWGVSTLKGALSTLTRLRAYAEAKGEYEAADNDVYSAQLVNSFLDEINVRAIEAAAAYHAKAEAEGKVLTEQQKRRDGRSAARTAFRSLRYLLDNAKIATAARDPLVFKRAFGTTVPRPTPSLEPPHYVQLCYLATNHRSRVVRGTAAGFALVASQTSRFKQAQACAILAEKGDVLYTAVQLDKSNEPHKQSARPAFGPILDVFQSRGVIDAVYDALSGVEDGCFLVRDNDSATGAPVDGCAFANGPILGGRADIALQYLLTLPPLACSPSAVQDFKVHSLKPMMLKHAARMSIGPVERHGLGRFSGSAAQSAALVPEPNELKKHKIKCAVLPDRYAQSSALARDARVAVQVSADLQGLAAKYTIAELSAMDWTIGEQGASDEPADGQTRGRMLLHRNPEIDMGYGPDEEVGSPGAGNSDVDSDDGYDPQ